MTFQKINKIQKGFTLIELLVVMAVIAVLAGIVLAGVNPLQQLARGRDANRINAISGLGRSMSNYATVTNNGVFPAVSTSWQTAMMNSGEIAALVTMPSNTLGNCTAANMHTGTNVCYIFHASDNASIWVTLESDLSRAKAPQPCVAPATPAYLWRADQGRSGYVCLAAATTAPTATQTMSAN